MPKEYEDLCLWMSLVGIPHFFSRKEEVVVAFIGTADFEIRASHHIAPRYWIGHVSTSYDLPGAMKYLADLVEHEGN